MRNFVSALVVAFLFCSPVFAADPKEGVKVETIVVNPSVEESVVKGILPFKEGTLLDETLLNISEKVLEASERYSRAKVLSEEKGRKVLVEVKLVDYFEGFRWRGDRLKNRRDLENLCIQEFEQRPLSQDRQSEIQRCVANELRSEGFLDVEVQVKEEDLELLIEVTQGERYRIRDIVFQGVPPEREKSLLRVIEHKSGGVFLPSQLRSETQELRSYYLDQNRFLTEVFDPSFEIDVQEKQVNLTWKIKESPKYDVNFKGGYRSAEFLKEFRAENETFPEWFVEDLVESIEEQLREDGYLDVQVSVEQSEPRDDRVQVNLTTTLGKRYRLRKPEWVGVRDLETVNEVYSDLDGVKAGRPFQRRSLTENVEKNLIVGLQAKGFIDAQLRGIDFSIDENVFEVTPVIYLSEGDRAIISRTEVRGVLPWHLDLDEMQDLQNTVELGETLNLIELNNRLEESVRALIKEGYLDAKASKRIESSPRGVAVSLDFDLGTRYKVANFFIKGAKRTKYDVISREILLQPGTYYLDELIQDSISNLLRLQILRSVDIRVFEKDPSQGLVYVQVEISEAARFRFSVGPGYGTLDGVRGVFRGTYANIGGSGRRFSLYAKASRLESVFQEDRIPTNVLRPREVPFIERRVSAEYFEPSLFGFRLDGRLNYTHRKEDESKYAVSSNSFGIAFDYRLTRRWLFTTRYDIEFSDTFNEEIEAGILQRARRLPAAKKRLTSIGEAVTADYLDDSFNPSEGVRVRAVFDLYDKYLGGDQNFWQSQVRSEFFYPLYRFSKARKIGFALSVRVGFSDVYRNTSDIPVETRFFVGGESSVRGYSEKEINPLLPDPAVPGAYLTRFEGGKSLFNFMTEINIPMIYDIDFLAFFDGGNVYMNNSSIKPWDLRLGAGAGLRLNTPLGPVKAGYGFIIDRRRIDGEREPLGSIYIGVGPI